ncbi:MAG: DegT/DnrJ/EryC1/StrS family aminotransferase, partial [Rhodothermales bacterium]|nr:DegT/DnrJ/EryC1/StrS family aminotransferase [Rhodothermales bacterium]
MSKIALSDVSLDHQEKAAVSRVIDSGWISMGPETKEFEGEFAHMHGTRFAVACTNGTAALHLAAMALDLGPGDEVIVPSLTFVASANGFAYTGASIRFADIVSDEDPTLNPASVAAALTPRTKAIVPVHYAGWMADMAELRRIADASGVQLVEDACHAVGGEGKDGRAGQMGAMGCFSFFPNKNMTVGEGGMVTTDDEKLDAALRLLRSHGMTSSSWDRDKGHAYEYDVVRRGFNYRIDEIRSAIGRVQLSKLPESNARRRQVVTWYRERLKDVPVTVPFLSRPVSETSAHVFTVTTRTPEERNHLNEVLRAQDIQTSRHYPPSHLFSIYRDAASESGPLTQTESYATR